MLRRQIMGLLDEVLTFFIGKTRSRDIRRKITIIPFTYKVMSFLSLFWITFFYVLFVCLMRTFVITNEITQAALQLFSSEENYEKHLKNPLVTSEGDKLTDFIFGINFTPRGEYLPNVEFVLTLLALGNIIAFTGYIASRCRKLSLIHPTRKYYILQKKKFMRLIFGFLLFCLVTSICFAYFSYSLSGFTESIL